MVRVVVHTCNLSTGEFKIIFSYVVSLRMAWAMKPCLEQAYRQTNITTAPPPIFICPKNIFNSLKIHRYFLY